jgi:hypothetical protein
LLRFKASSSKGKKEEVYLGATIMKVERSMPSGAVNLLTGCDNCFTSTNVIYQLMQRLKDFSVNGKSAGIPSLAAIQHIASKAVGGNTGASPDSSVSSLPPPNGMVTITTAAIHSQSFLNKVHAFVVIVGRGFSSADARIFINGRDVTSQVYSQTDIYIQLKGDKENLNFTSGKNQIIVATPVGTSNTFEYTPGLN